MICLTFDTDYMTQEGIEEFLSKYPFPGKATFFVHQPFSILESTPHEVCPHPFINSLSSWTDEIGKIVELFSYQPQGIRMHSCLFSHMIGIGLNSLKYKYISQAQRLFQIGLKPYRHPWGIWEMPIYYMDNMDFCMLRNWPDIGHITFNPNIIKAAVESESLYVFDIHPLHVALNTPNYEDYCSVREKIVKDGESPFDLQFDKRGVGVFFKELCANMESSGQRSYTCMEALKHFGCI